MRSDLTQSRPYVASSRSMTRLRTHVRLKDDSFLNYAKQISMLWLLFPRKSGNIYQSDIFRTRGSSRLLEEIGSTKVSRCNDTCIPKVSTIVRIVLTLWINMATTVLCDDLLDDFLYLLLSFHSAGWVTGSTGEDHGPQKTETYPREKRVETGSLQELPEMTLVSHVWY
jgi:hypothetical protein